MAAKRITTAALSARIDEQDEKLNAILAAVSGNAPTAEPAPEPEPEPADPRYAEAQAAEDAGLHAAAEALRAAADADAKIGKAKRSAEAPSKRRKAEKERAKLSAAQLKRVAVDGLTPVLAEDGSRIVCHVGPDPKSGKFLIVRASGDQGKVPAQAKSGNNAYSAMRYVPREALAVLGELA